MTTEKIINTEDDVETTADKSNNLDIYKDLAPLVGNEIIGKDGIVIASGKHSDVSRCVDHINNLKGDASEFTTEELYALGLNIRSEDKPIKDDMLSELVNNGDFTNNIIHNRVKLGIESINIKSKGKLNGADAVAKIISMMGIGKHVNIRLWQSGFSIVVSPPNDRDIMSMNHLINKTEDTVGKDTNNFIFSNYSAMLHRIFMDFVIPNIIQSNFALPEGASYSDYIRLPDIQAVAVGMATAIRPNGFKIDKSCKNTLVFENGKPVCDFTGTATVIPENLMWVNRSELTTEMLDHISKSGDGIHSEEDVLWYQAQLTCNQEIVKTLNINEAKIELTLQVPTITKSINYGALWIEGIIRDAELVLTDNANADTREPVIDTLVMSTMVNKYGHYIKKITNDGSYVDTNPSVMDLLNYISSDTQVAKDILKSIIDFINNSYISIAAVYNFNCPTCKSAGRDPEQGVGEIKGFSEFIPLNALESFFDLCALRIRQITERGE